MNIYIVRHTAVDVQEICYGQSDVPLKDTFESEAEVVKRNLPKVNFDAVYSSPLSRCTRLATYCGFADEMRLDRRLLEVNFGDWEMKRWKELDFSHWMRDRVNTVPPNGESLTQMMRRISNFYDDLGSNGHSNIMIFAHGGVINCTRHYFGEIELDGVFDNLVSYGEMLSFKLRK